MLKMLPKIFKRVLAPLVLAIMLTILPAADLSLNFNVSDIDAVKIQIVQTDSVVVAQDNPNDQAAQAEGTNTAVGAGQQSLNQVLLTFANLLSLVLQAMYLFIWPVLAAIGMFMDNSLIFSFGMEERLLEVWQQIRNLINIGAVLGLVGLALYNVLGVDTDGNYTLKKILPRFVLALLLVNFSFFGVKLVIDAANVVTAAMFTLPNSVEVSTASLDPDELGRRLCGVASNVSSSSSTGRAQDVETSVAVVGSALCSGDTLNSNARTLFQQFSQSNMALLMAVQFGQIDQLLNASNLIRSNPSIPTLTINVILSVAYYVIYAAGFVALLMILVARVVVLWASVALAPVLALSFALPSGVGSDSLGQLKDHFLKHLLAPIKIGFAMSLGYIMLSAIQQVGPDSLRFQFADQFLAPFSGISSVQEFIVAAGSIGVVWMAISRASKDTLAGKFVDQIFDWVGDAGRVLAQSPLYIPLPTGTKKSGPTLGNLIGDARGRLRNVENQQNITALWKDNDQNNATGQSGTSNNLLTFVNNNYTAGKINSSMSPQDAKQIVAALADKSVLGSTSINYSEYLQVLGASDRDALNKLQTYDSALHTELTSTSNKDKKLKDLTGTPRDKLINFPNNLFGSDVGKLQKTAADSVNNSRP